MVKLVIDWGLREEDLNGHFRVFFFWGWPYDLKFLLKGFGVSDSSIKEEG